MLLRIFNTDIALEYTEWSFFISLVPKIISYLALLEPYMALEPQAAKLG